MTERADSPDAIMAASSDQSEEVAKSAASAFSGEFADYAQSRMAEDTRKFENAHVEPRRW